VAKTYDKMTLAELRGLADQRMQGVLERVGTMVAGGQVAEAVPEPTEPPVTDLPLPAARARAVKAGMQSMD
jgi:hypothetical protein